LQYLILYVIFNNKYKYNIYINNKFGFIRETLFIYFVKKYSDKIETNRAGTKLKQINIYGY